MILEDRLAILENLHLHASGGSIENACFMNVVDYITGGDGRGDHPECASPSITAFAIQLNDAPRFAEYRDELKPFITRVVGTVGTPEQEMKRAFMVSDWAVRVIAPLAVDAAGLHEYAAKLRALPEIVDQSTAAAADAAAAAAADAARYAADAADAAAAAAAADAARYAACYAADAVKRLIWDESLKMLDALIKVTEAV